MGSPASPGRQCVIGSETGAQEQDPCRSSGMLGKPSEKAKGAGGSALGWARLADEADAVLGLGGWPRSGGGWRRLQAWALGSLETPVSHALLWAGATLLLSRKPLGVLQPLRCQLDCLPQPQA